MHTHDGMVPARDRTSAQTSQLFDADLATVGAVRRPASVERLSVLQAAANRSLPVRQLKVIQSRANQVAPGHGVAQRAALPGGHGVVQAVPIGGIEVTFSPGYTSWVQDDNRWHINWRLGESNVYHVTDEDTNPKTHYFFVLSSSEISDAVAPKDMKGKKGSSKKFSALPGSVAAFVRTNIDALMPQ